MTATLVLREVPFRAGAELILAEAAAVVAWALEAGHEIDTTTWLSVDPEQCHLAVGVRSTATPDALPAGLESRPAPDGTGEMETVCFDSFREGPRRCIRIDHHHERGHPVAAAAYPLSPPARA